MVCVLWRRRIKALENPFVEEIEQALTQQGLTKAKLVRELYSAQSFGNALADYEVGHIMRLVIYCLALLETAVL